MKIKAALIAIIFSVGAALITYSVKAQPHPQPQDGCPFSVTCSLDGGAMYAEQTFLNGIHVSKQFGHNHEGQHHYVIVQCQ